MEDIIRDSRDTHPGSACALTHHYAIQNDLPLDFRPYPEIKKVKIWLTDYETTSDWNQPVYLHSGIKSLMIMGCPGFNQPLDLSHCRNLRFVELRGLKSFNQKIHFPLKPETTIDWVWIIRCPRFNQSLNLSHIHHVGLKTPNNNQPIRLHSVDALENHSDTFNQDIEIQGEKNTTLKLRPLQTRSMF